MVTLPKVFLLDVGQNVNHLIPLNGFMKLNKKSVLLTEVIFEITFAGFTLAVRYSKQVRCYICNVKPKPQRN